MLRWLGLTVVTLVLAAGLACNMARSSPSGFRLPPGNAEAGKAAFLELQCSTCHTVKGVELPPPTATPVVPLGEKKGLPQTAGEMTTDIILPSSHFAPVANVEVDGKSKMPDFTGKMTIRQLADLVAFLQAR